MSGGLDSAAVLRLNRERLRVALSRVGPGENKAIIKKAVGRAVLSIFKMAGSLKFWEHIYRIP